MTGFKHMLRVTLSSFMFIFVVIGSVSAVADKALPGDALYAFKIHINEEIKTVFIRNETQKVAWQKERVTNRLNEIRTLADSQTLTKAQQQSAGRALDTSIRSLSRELTTLESRNPADALTRTTQIHTELQEKKQELLLVLPVEENITSPVLQSLELSVRTLQQKETVLLSRELDRLEQEILTSPLPLETPLLSEEESSPDKQIPPQEGLVR